MRTLSKADLTIRIGETLRAYYPQATVAYPAAGNEIILTFPAGEDGRGGGKSSFGTDNTYREYLADPSPDRDERAVERIVGIMRNTCDTLLATPTDREYAQIADKLRVQLGWPSKTLTDPDGQPVDDPRLRRAWGKHGAVLYVAIDYPDRIVFVSHPMLEGWGVDEATIWQRAIDQTREQLRADEPIVVPTDGDDPFEFAVWQDTGGYDGTRIVFPELLADWRPRYENEGTLLLAHDRDFFALVRFRGRAMLPAIATLGNIRDGRANLPRLNFPSMPFFLRADGTIKSFAERLDEAQQS